MLFALRAPLRRALASTHARSWATSSTATPSLSPDAAAREAAAFNDELGAVFGEAVADTDGSGGSGHGGGGRGGGGDNSADGGGPRHVVTAGGAEAPPGVHVHVHLAGVSVEGLRVLAQSGLRIVVALER